MKKFLKTHSEAVFIALIVIFLAMIIGFLYVTTRVVVVQAERVIGSPAPQTSMGFDLQDAAKINFKGLLDSSTTGTQ